MLKYFIICNGIYDIICALSILLLDYNDIFYKISRLHINMYYPNQINNDIKRYLSYSILLYGYIRIFCFYNSKYLTAISYYIEAILFINEYIFYKKIYKNKMIFVSGISFIIGTNVILFLE